MARTKAASVNNSESSSHEIDSVNDTKDAFKACVNHEIDSQFYRETPVTFFTRHASRMMTLFTGAEKYAIKIGQDRITEMRAAVVSKEDDYARNNSTD